MKKLDRKKYNEIIEKLNNHSIEKDEAIVILLDQYKSVLCHISDYEEIVMLLNLCIAMDRTNQYDELYTHYRKADDILIRHSGYGLFNAYELYYCIGIFSFKFHEYRKAHEYFKKCIDSLKKIYKTPYKCDTSKWYYIRSQVLISYALEYDTKSDGAINAINNIIDSLNCEPKVEEIFTRSPANTVNLFFEHNPSQVYNNADEHMKKEIVHMLAHCFSEYSCYLRRENGKSIQEAYFWELLSEKFIDNLGNDMITCKATILAEHGHYYQALDILRTCLKDLASNEKERAEVAFYIYYFSNRIGLNNKESQQCKDVFLNYAKSAHNKDTKLYAWITEFRAEFSKSIQESSVEAMYGLENFFNSDDFDMHNYVHIQIQEEAKRLQMAYQIIRSYRAINNESPIEPDNSLFEKCIIFNSYTEVAGNSIQQIVDEQDYYILFHGVVLYVRGISNDICSALNKYFGADICVSEKIPKSNQKVLLCTNKGQIAKLIDSADSLTYYVYCNTPELLEEFKKEIDGAENYYFFMSLEDTFKVSYIQETIENCYDCAYRWNEYFIMAPITDNSTFAFQSQSIDKYIRINTDSEQEKAIFSDKNGYVTSDFVEPHCIRKIQSPYQFPYEACNRPKRIFFYMDNWVYKYDPRENTFIPETLCENISNIKLCIKPLNKRSVRSDHRRKICNCPLKISQCLCSELPLSKYRDRVNSLLMSMSLGLVASGEDSCTLLFPQDSQKENIDSFMIILSDESLRNCQLRCFFDELLNYCRMPNTIEKEGETLDGVDGAIKGNESSETSDIKNKSDISKEIILLKSNIKVYIEQKRNLLSESDMQHAQDIQSRVEKCEDPIDPILYMELKSEWENFIGGV